MTAVRLRPAHSPEKLAELYRRPHKHDQWVDHVDRVARTVAFIGQVFGRDFESAADLSCGDAAILRALDVDNVYLGDFAPSHRYTGPLEQTLEQIPPVELYVCTETLEHVDNPAAVLRLIRDRAEFLVLSTPIDAWDDPNEEHYWAWSSADVEALLDEAGFTVTGTDVVDWTASGAGFYRFGLWGCM